MRDYRTIRKVLLRTMLLNFAATVVKLVVGLMTGALSLVADGLDSLFDGLANVVGLVGIELGRRPPDANHPYGHRKIETMAALAIAGLLFLVCWELVRTAFERLLEPRIVFVNSWSYAALLFSIIVQGATSIYELRQGRRLNSEILVADALHARASILSSLAVMAGLTAVRLGYPTADSLLALFVALLIAKIGVDIVRENIPPLLDQAAIDESLVAEIVQAVPGVESFHRIRSRGHADASVLDLHVRVAPEITMQEANAIADEVRRRLLEVEQVSDVTVHVEAQRRPGREATGARATVQRAAQELGLQVHELWLHQVEGEHILELHVGVEPHLTVGKAHDLVDRLERTCLQRLPELDACQSHIELQNPEILPGARVSKAMEASVADAVARAIAQTPGLQAAHNLSVRQSEGRLTLSFEVLADEDLPISIAHELTSQLEARLRSRFSNLGEVLIHVEPNAQTPPEQQDPCLSANNVS